MMGEEEINMLPIISSISQTAMKIPQAVSFTFILFSTNL